ncbi:LAMI_0C08372g1_1 [Lachancea mirantina]|uniref:LAMI_0C08372g1_1 n=1 Tax=Lachancea mirantina TaxID=1230905 RepID=A0A1G4J4G3_9SACH|nr:LAMI_0C08372g1_1 [Lachancea mirantina]
MLEISPELCWFTSESEFSLSERDTDFAYLSPLQLASPCQFFTLEPLLGSCRSTPTVDPNLLLEAPLEAGDALLKFFSGAGGELSSTGSNMWSIDDVLDNCQATLASHSSDDDEALLREPTCNVSETTVGSECVVSTPMPCVQVQVSDPVTVIQSKPDLKPTARRTSATHKCTKKRSWKINKTNKKAVLNKLIENLQTETGDEPCGMLLRKNVARELDIDVRDKTARLEFSGFKLAQVQALLDRKASNMLPERQFRTLWMLARQQSGTVVQLEFKPFEKETADLDQIFVFSVISRYLPYGCFGKTATSPKKKQSAVQESLRAEELDKTEHDFCWRHFITSYEYFKMVTFMLGDNYDFNVNDNQSGETRGSDGKLISAEKRHDMRTRSHAKMYFEGKAVKSANELSGDETSECRRQFIVGTFSQIMNYNYRKPYGSDSSLSVMEFKYLEDALNKEINFHIFHEIGKCGV